MDSRVEYRPGLLKSFLMIFPGIFFLGLTIVLLSTGPLPSVSKQLPGLMMCGVADLAMVVLLCYGIAVLILSRLSFDSNGFSFQDVGTTRLSFRWKDITAVSIQNLPKQGVSNYRVIVKLRDQAKFLEGLPKKTRESLEKQCDHLEEGIPIDIQNIRVSAIQLKKEFSHRTKAPITVL